MNEEKKKYYWIKLRTDFFNREEIDFLLSQDNGCQYVVLYQMLCLNTANSNGRLETQMNEVIMPYDTKKIVRDCKYFDIDTVVVALELYKKLGLIYEEEDNILKISNIERMIGSESATRDAIKKREQRLKKKIGTSEGTNCLTENRDKDIRDKSIDIEKNNKYIVEQILDYLNLKTNSNYKASTQSTITKINARLKEGFTIDDFKLVIDKKLEEWYGTEFQQYLRPDTLFGTKFESYLNQTIVKRQKKETQSEKIQRLIREAEEEERMNNNDKE